jgi:hypothetical protein
MAMLKKKTRKAIRKSFKKVINKHGPVVAQHLATGLAAAAATYVGAGSKKSHKQLKKVAKSIPGGKTILKAVTESIPLLKAESHHSNSNGHRTGHTTRKRGKRSKKHEPSKA